MKRPDTQPKTTNNTIYKIDQSGRVEYTSHDTVIAFSNGKKKAILIKAAEKRVLQNRFREARKIRIFPLRIFALMIALLLKKESFQEIIIDTEYPGRSDLIKNYILHDFKRFGREIDPSLIHFRQIGKNTEAHWHGYYCFKGERKAEINLTSKEILKEIFH